MWSLPVPNDSYPHSYINPASIRFPKNFHPVGVSYIFKSFFNETSSIALEVGMLRATPKIVIYDLFPERDNVVIFTFKSTFLFKIRYTVIVRCYYSERIRWSYKKFFAEYHISISITIACCSKIRNRLLLILFWLILTNTHDWN